MQVKAENSYIAYYAISYLWGDTVKTKDILLNGRPIAIRLNLYNLLRELSRRKVNQLLWIDAICIDQANTSERNHQVAKMGETYSDAAGVVVWLGLGSENTNRAMRYLQQDSNT